MKLDTAVFLSYQNTLCLTSFVKLQIVQQGAPAEFTATKASNAWLTQGPAFQAKVYSLDDSFYAEYAKYLNRVLFQLPLKLKQCKNKPLRHLPNFHNDCEECVQTEETFGFIQQTKVMWLELVQFLRSPTRYINHSRAKVSNMDAGYYDPIVDFTASLVIGNKVFLSRS